MSRVSSLPLRVQKNQFSDWYETEVGQQWSVAIVIGIRDRRENEPVHNGLESPRRGRSLQLRR